MNRVVFVLFITACSYAQQTHKADLLVVGGSESGVAAAVQAAAMGVRKIILVNDIPWLGGQFSAEAVGAVDEWTMYRGRRVNFPRSGLFLHVMRLIREHNGRKFGVATPGNAFTATDTIEPKDAAEIFASLLDRHRDNVHHIYPYRPIKALLTGRRVTGFVFENTRNAGDRITVEASITIDASDWGDAIRLSGAPYSAGPDLKSRFGEENAPAGPLGEERNEMNPITYCAVIRESPGAKPIPRPAEYDERRYFGSNATTYERFRALPWPPKVWSSRVPLYVDTDYPEGPYSSVNSLYTYRRLVDRRHNGLPPGTEKLLLHFAIQDYPLWAYPRSVTDKLEGLERGASKKNIVDMTYPQREVVFEDAKNHTLGFLHFLQTTAHDAHGDYPQSFRYFELTDEFGTPDRLPWKPYIREGLRLEALYMLHEQDIKAHHESRDESAVRLQWARVMPHDNVFGFQFNIDFHPTRRIFLNNGTSGPWMLIQTENRNWSTHTDRAGFPLRGLIPLEADGLLGAGKNLGVSSIVSSALRLHGQTMMAGQAAAAAAAFCLEHGIQPRQLVRNHGLVRDLQLRLVRGGGYPGILLWPYHDVSPDDRHFIAANMLSVMGIYQPDNSLDFDQWKPVTRRELAVTLARALRSRATANPWAAGNGGPFPDLPANDRDRAAIASLASWGVLESGAFRPDDPADWRTLHSWLTAAGLPASGGIAQPDRRLGSRSPVLNRAEMVLHLWAAIRGTPEWYPEAPEYLAAAADTDGDGIRDLEDGMPFDRNNNRIPDRLEYQRQQ